jgi:uncharacterized protein
MYFQVQNSSVRIAGSVHHFPRVSPEVPAWLWEAYDWSEHLMVESDPTGNPDARRCLQSNRSLLRQIGIKTWLKLALRWPQFALNPSNYWMKPWAVLATLPHLVLSLTPGVESQLTQRARRELKQIGELERSAELAQILDGISIEVIGSRIRRFLGDIEGERRTILDLHRAWRSGDVPSISLQVNRLPIAEIPEMRRSYLQIRNRNWLGNIRGAIEDTRRTLIVVGVVHLFGDDNLIDMLNRETGYTCTLISP